MSEMRFDGRVAIVTGAGGNPGLGRAYAMLLAARGAKVVVNDDDSGPDGRGTHPASAETVAQEIVDAGGEAIADNNSVATKDSAEAVVQTALDQWGKVDILVNNAGIAFLAEFDELTDGDIQRIIDVHLMGTIWMSRAVWPHMKEAGYGRIVSASSSSMLGQRYVTVYGAAKGGIFSMMRGLAVEGDAHGIKANSFGPGAKTKMSAMFATEDLVAHMPPAELVAPTIAFLCHEDCPVNGHYFEAAAGMTKYRYFAETKGIMNPETNLEYVRDNWSEVMDTGNQSLVPEPLEHPVSNIIQRKEPYVPA